jgi:hypothetical protein
MFRIEDNSEKTGDQFLCFVIIAVRAPKILQDESRFTLTLRRFSFLNVKIRTLATENRLKRGTN